MPKILRRCLLALAVASLAAVGGAGTFSALAAPPARVAGRLLVKARPAVPEAVVQSMFARHGVREQGIISHLDVRILKVPEQRLEWVLAALSQDQDFEWAEPDYILEPALTPNDPYYSMEWHLPRIQAPAAWDITTGSPEVIVAILDSGIDSAHPEFAGKLVAGWNFFDNNADTSDITGHGTGVAGAAAGSGNNGVGVAPLAWGCKIMPLRVSDVNGYSSISTMANALTWAADHGARVANASFAIGGTSSTLSTAAQYFQSKGGVFTVSAGNDGAFDASPDDAYILRVSATESSDVIASYSGSGNNIDLSAPGSGILTATKGGGFGSGTGTSFSAPVVAGVAALVFSANPALSGAQAQTILKESTDDLGAPGWDTIYGSGRVNALKAVQAAINTGSGDSTAPTAQILSPATGNALSGAVTVNVGAADNVGVTRVDLYLNGTAVGSSATAPAAFSWDTTQYANGDYTLQARAYDAAGNSGDSAAVTVSLQNAIPDTTVPTVQITSPGTGATLSGTVNVNVSASDDVGVTRVEWYLNGALSGSGSGASALFSWNTTALANGAYTLQARAYDAAGNTGASTSVSVTVQNVVADTLPPAVAIVSPAGGARITAKSTPVSVTASDNVAVARVELLVDGKRYATSTSATPTFTWNTSKLRVGKHTLQSVAYDAAGNLARSSVVSVTK